MAAGAVLQERSKLLLRDCGAVALQSAAAVLQGLTTLGKLLQLDLFLLDASTEVVNSTSCIEYA
jgi:hypothetical protein